MYVVSSSQSTQRTLHTLRHTHAVAVAMFLSAFTMRGSLEAHTPAAYCRNDAGATALPLNEVFMRVPHRTTLQR